MRANFAGMAPVKELQNRAPWNNVVIGILVFVSRGFIRPLPESVDTNLFVTGIAIGVIALITMIAQGNVRRNYFSALNVLAGIWLIVSAQVLPAVSELGWAQVCLGVLTITIALTSLANERSNTRRLMSGPGR
jgi:uncharacterized membrane protein SirB2